MGYNGFNDEGSVGIPPSRLSEDHGKDIPARQGREIGLATHEIGLEGGSSMTHEVVCKAAPGHHQLVYLHRDNIRAMHRGVTASGDELDDAVAGSGS